MSRGLAGHVRVPGAWVLRAPRLHLLRRTAGLPGRFRALFHEEGAESQLPSRRVRLAMRTLVALMLSAMFTTVPHPGGSTGNAQSVTPEPTTYARLVDRLKAADRTVDFTELRMAFTETPAYRGMMMGFYQPLWRALN